MASLLSPHSTSVSPSTSGGLDGDSKRGSDAAFSYRQADRPDPYHGAAPEQDWWNRLSCAQIDLLKPLAAQWFEKLDDALFDRSSSSFQQFFEGMRILRKNRDVLTQAWFDRLDEGWSALRPQMPGAFRPRLVSAGSVAVEDAVYAGLSLVDEVTLERKLAVENAIARGLSLCRMELPPLLHRLTLLRKGAAVHAEDLPAAPAMLTQTFARSLDEMPGLPVEVALVAFKLFDRIVVSTVGTACQELNCLLVQGGVVPQWIWSPTSGHRPARPAPPSSAAVSQSAGPWGDTSWLETVPSLDAEAHAAAMATQFAGSGQGYRMPADLEYALQDFSPGRVEQARLSASVRALLEHRRMARYGAGWAHIAGHQSAAVARTVLGSEWSAVAPAPTQQLELETLMEVLASLPPPTLPTSWTGEPEETNWDPDQLKRELHKTLTGRMRQAAAAKSAKSHGEKAPEAQDMTLGEHEDVIDMVAMMFGFIQQDEALPAAVQALLSRLQLPYLRLALADPKLFLDAGHPARALMDRLAEVGKSCTPDSPMLAEKMLKMHALVGRIVDNHEVTRTFFEREWAKFRTWSDALAERASARERDQVAALVEAEPLALAEESAAEADAIAADSSAEASAGSRAHRADSQDERARQHQIRLAVTARMHERLEGKVMPEGLRHTLSLLWVNHQVRVWEKHGERSYEASWLDRQLDAAIGLLCAKPGVQAQEGLKQDWPSLQQAWARVLAEGPAPADARARWIVMFRRWADERTGYVAADPSFRWNWHEGLTVARAGSVAAAHPQPDPVSSAQPETAEESAPAQAPGSTGESVSAGTSAFKITPILTKPGPARWTIGDWIEFKDAADAAQKTGRADRGKVSWIGSFTGRTILVKPDGTLWREESRTDLDDLLDRGLAFIVPRASLFDRSLQSMFHTLRDSVASTLS